KSVLNLPVEVLKRYCHLDQVADFANLTLFIYNTNNTASNTQLSDNTIPYSIKLLLLFLFVLVGFIGLIGNMLTVLVICKTTSLHSHTNYFLASLAISDLLLIIVGVPFDLFHLWRKDRPPAIAGYCALMSTSISLFTFASILTIVSLTAERFVAICYPFSHRAIFDKRRVIYLIYTIWALAFFPSLYIGLQFKRVVPDFCGYNRELNSQRGSCDYVTSQNIPFRYPFELTMVVTFVLPLIFIVYCYVRILATLNEMATATRVHVPIGSTNSTDSSHLSILYVHTKNFAPPKSQQAQRMVMKMLFTVTAVFFVCYLPYHIERLIVQYTKHQCDSSMFCLLLYPVTGLLQYISATLNPIFYNLMSTRFRTAFTQLLHQILPKHKRNYGSIARM
ncbi:Neuropeptides capa receptor, partial [Trichostrongylus colubriformis]